MDWAEVQRKIETSLRFEARDEGAILKARAKRLAGLAREAPPPALECLVFESGGAYFAIETVHVARVHPLETPTPLPGTPDFVLGIANVRGEIVSVLDIGRLTGIPGETDARQAIVVESGGMGFGLAASSILGVEDIPRAGIIPAGEDLLKGRHGRTLLIDGEKLIGDGRIVVNDEFLHRGKE